MDPAHSNSRWPKEVALQMRAFGPSITTFVLRAVILLPHRRGPLLRATTLATRPIISSIANRPRSVFNVDHHKPKHTQGFCPPISEKALAVRKQERVRIMEGNQQSQ
jgi:hypothetical protein